MQVALLAERLRVEERMISEVLKARGISSSLIKPAALAVDLNRMCEPLADLVFDRAVSTRPTASLGALLANHGAVMISRPATTRLIADRLALIRHLVIAGLPVPESRICFGEGSALEAIDELGYPVVIKTLDVDPGFPSAFVEDRDSAEAIIEHRIVLGHEQTTLLQRFQHSVYERSLRAVVIGSEPVAFDARPHDGWRPNATETYENVSHVSDDVRDLARDVVSRVGTGVYAILMIETESGAVVTGIENLVTFRHLKDVGLDAAELIVDFGMSQLPVAAAS